MPRRDDPARALREAMAEAGVPTSDPIVADGRIHRFHVEGDRRSRRNGWYLLHADDPANGRFGCWKRGVWEAWYAEQPNGTKSDAERAEWRRKVEETRRRQAEELSRRRAQARERAARLWERAGPADPDHPYLTDKAVGVHGIRQLGDRLLIPVYGAEGTLHGLQRIGADGTKRFLGGTEVTGSYHPIGEPDGTVVVAEGYATAASIHEATGRAVAVAYAAGNLEPVAQALRTKLGPDVTIIIAADDDRDTDGNPGVTAATEAARAVGGLLAVPGQPGDFNDLAKAQGPEVVAAAISGASEPAGTDDEARPVELRDLLTMDLPPRQWAIEGLLQQRDLGMLHAYRGVGKSRLVHGLAVAVAAGAPFMRWRAPEPRGVLLVDGELPREDLQGMLAQAVTACGHEPAAPVHVLSADLAGAPVRSLATDRGRAQVERYLGGSEVVIIDSITTLCPGAGPENDAESWEGMQSWLLDLRRQGLTVLLVHHDGKGGAQRGTSKREDVLSQIVQLRRPSDYRPSEGARFEVHFTKSRGLVGEAAEPFEATLTEDEHGRPVWTWRPLEDARRRRILELRDLDMSVRDIADELGIPKSTVHDIMRRSA